MGYQFDAARYESEGTVDLTAKDGDFGRTHGWADNLGPARPPAITELVGQDIGNRVVLTKPEYWIGADPACEVGRPDDPFCEPRHVRLYHHPRGDWFAENNKTQNGLWLRMPQVAVDSLVQFQIGEQRFRLRVT